MNRREIIIEAALQSFDATGETAIEEIKQRSGASIGSIYHHFGGRDGVAAALYIEILRGYQAGLLRALEGSGSAEEGVGALVRHHLRWVEGNPVRARYLLQSGAARLATGDELKQLNRGLAAAVAGWVEAQPAIRPLRGEVFYAVVIGPAQELSRAWLGGRMQAPGQLEDELAAAAWRAVRADGPS